ncbi:Cif family virulence factor [Flavisphingomonas formosensis]|uniref:nuclear transport factor 2 family protein n=1 Tax=Flavisphingomonas formosensis TaxID=861534 RepID=UPI0012FBB975|nr:nuclear transport factor 2 family protein [Sphingomonas formosensis]
MKRSILLAAAAALTMAMPAQAAAPARDMLSQMFLWWDAAFKRPDGFTPEAFRTYFTDDATLTLEGKTVIRGIPEWVEHFRKIQASGREVEIVVPFKDVFQQGNRIFTYHVIRSRGAGKVTCALAAGDAVLRGGKIASIMLVRTNLDEAGLKAEPDCWTQ